MKYEEFIKKMKQLVEDHMGENYGISLEDVIKNNDIKRKGLTVKKYGEHVGPIIYLEEYFEDFQNGSSLDYCFNEFIKVYRKAEKNNPITNLEFMSWENAKKNVVPKLVNHKKNEQLLLSVPHILYNDLAIVFYIQLEEVADAIATVLIKNEWFKLWNVKTVELYELALSNAEKLLPLKFTSMISILQKQLDMNVEIKESDLANDGMYVLTNETSCQGAVCMLYENALDKIGNILKENFYIIPSSVNECIIVVESAGINKSGLEEMIREVNDTQVDEHEILSYNAYYYDRKTKIAE